MMSHVVVDNMNEEKKEKERENGETSKGMQAVLGRVEQLGRQQKENNSCDKVDNE